MFLSLNWLRDFVDIPKSITPEELGVRLTMHTVEIDGVENESDKFKGVVVGELLEVKTHPNADRLRLARVNIGKDALDIVCGAPNIEPGQKVPVALVGTVLPNGLEIKEADIRGERSCGMLCAEDELGLGEDHGGIMILNAKTKVGMPFAEYLGLNDVVFEVDNKSITNRPDLWGHYGMAREIGTFLELKNLRDYSAKSQKDIRVDAQEGGIPVKVEDFGLCPRYMALVIDNITVKESPKWLRDRLIAVGVRPINNIVDITNYVMLEIGQPMHAFDRQRLDSISVRRAKKGEAITTLDGEKRDLTEEDLVIADSRNPVAIAGVMGGENSEIGDSTKSIVLESANFNFLSVRKTSGRLGLRTEASMRFEKSMDPNLCELALVRAVELIRDVDPAARISGPAADEKKFKLNQGPIMLDMAWLQMILGEELEKTTVIKILNRLGFTVADKDNELEVTVPTWRATKDISIKEDIAEEVARIYGYGKLKPAMPRIEIRTPETDPLRIFERKAKHTLATAAGLVEVFNYSFVSEDQLKKMGIDHSGYLRLANPITKNHTLLRQSLVPHLLSNIRTNQARISNRGFFEVGSVFLSCPGDIEKDERSDDKLPFQEKRLAIAYIDDGADDLMLAFKGVVIESFMAYFGLEPRYSLNANAPDWSVANAAVTVDIGKQAVGTINIVQKASAQKLGMKKQAVVAEFSLSELFRAYSQNSVKTFREFDKYPSVARDIAFVVDNNIMYNELKDEIGNFNALIKKVNLFDVYHGEKIGAGKKNLAFHVIYQADRTMTSDEVDKIQKELVKHLEAKFGAVIRDF